MTKTNQLLTIGDVAAIVGLATSTLRYYERLGLVAADVRVSGQRRYSRGSVRRVIFVQMLQDAGLSLTEIRDIMQAAENAEWKAIGAARLAQLDDELARLTHARDLLAGALLCRYDHPLDECHIMNTEIDRRLNSTTTTPRAAPTRISR